MAAILAPKWLPFWTIFEKINNLIPLKNNNGQIFSNIFDFFSFDNFNLNLMHKTLNYMYLPPYKIKILRPYNISKLIWSPPPPRKIKL